MLTHRLRGGPQFGAPWERLSWRLPETVSRSPEVCAVGPRPGRLGVRPSMPQSWGLYLRGAWMSFWPTRLGWRLAGRRYCCR
jgi:hypothetical protein